MDLFAAPVVSLIEISCLDQRLGAAVDVCARHFSRTCGGGASAPRITATLSPSRAPRKIGSRMGIDYFIDHERRLVRVTVSGVVTPDALFEYQKTVWSDPAVEGYDELVDMSAVTNVQASSHTNVNALAGFSAKMDGPSKPSKLAIVAADDLVFGLGRMYQAYREMKPGSNKEVAVFRSMPDALTWLGR